MSFKVLIPKKIEKFILSLDNSEILFLKLKLLKFFKSGEKLNLDIKIMKGSWKGYYRLRIGQVRFIFTIVDNKIIFVEKADFRGKIYS
jgi:mRNA-degrading endonuclease RelE of RelBE toxin-antitoxin system